MVSHYLSPLVWDTDTPGCWRAPDGCALGLDLRSLADQGLAGSYGDWPWAYVLSETAQAGDDLIPLGSGRVDEIRPNDQITRDAWRRCTGQQAIGDTLLDWIWSLATDQADPTGDTPLKPILPTREGNSELWLPLHSLVRSRRFAWRPKADRYCNRVRDVLRRDLESCAAADMRLAERALDAVCRKYGCAPQEISDKVRRGRATTTVSDDFSSDLSAWTVYNGTYAISGGRVRKTATDVAYEHLYHGTALSAADHYSQAVVYWGSASSNSGPSVRASTSAVTFYTAYWSGLNQITLTKLIAGTASALATSYDAATSGNLWHVDIAGSKLTLTYGRTNYQTTDTAITGNLRAGLFFRRTYAAGGLEMDDFKASDGLAAGGLYKRIVGGGVI